MTTRACRPIPAAMLVAMVGLGACSAREEAPPVAAMSLTISKDRAPLGAPLDLTYRFEPLAPIEGDYRVFAHVVAPDGTLMWTDDHDPQPPTSTWRPGEPIEYQRTVFIPLFPYLGDATIRMGLHRGSERLPLSGGQPGEPGVDERAYAVGSLHLLPQSESIFLIYGSGWHPAEYSADDPTRSWQWTEKSALLTFRNPRRDVTLYLQYDARADLFGETPQQVTVIAGTRAIETFAAAETHTMLRRIPLSTNDLDMDDMVELRLLIDRTFSPARTQSSSTDLRELGVRVYHVYVEPR
ncbi:MAG TPA: hypothetical protein VMM93_04290 [Vicinamibacterales bacterium]|nr:hypothetical protein [Vicinamibacterales bacterium]